MSHHICESFAGAVQFINSNVYCVCVYVAITFLGLPVPQIRATDY